MPALKGVAAVNAAWASVLCVWSHAALHTCQSTFRCSGIQAHTVHTTSADLTFRQRMADKTPPQLLFDRHATPLV